MAVQRRYDVGRMRQIGYGDRAAQLNAMRGGSGGPMPQGMLGDPAMQDPNAVQGIFGDSSVNAGVNQGLMAFGSNLLAGAGEGRSFGNAIGQAGIQGAMSGFGAYQGEQQRQQGLAQRQQQLDQIGMLAEQQGLSPEQQGVLMGIAQQDPGQALGMLGEQAFPEAPDPVAQGRLDLEREKFAASQQQAQRPDYDRYRNVPDVGLVDLQTGEVLQAPQAGPEPMSAYQEAQLGLRQEELALEREKAAREAAGGPAPTFAEEETIKVNAKELPKLTTGIAKNTGRLDVLKRAQQLNEQVPYSRFGNLLQSGAGVPGVSAALDVTGIYTDEDKAAADQWESLVNEYARTGREPGSGPMSDADLKLARQELGDLTTSREGRSGNIGRKIEELTKATATDQLTAQLVSQNPSMSIAEARSQAQQQIEAQQQQQQAPGQPSPQQQQMAQQVGESWQDIVQTAQEEGMTPEQVIQRLQQRNG